MAANLSGFLKASVGVPLSIAQIQLPTMALEDLENAQCVTVPVVPVESFLPVHDMILQAKATESNLLARRFFVDAIPPIISSTG